MLAVSLGACRPNAQAAKEPPLAGETESWCPEGFEAGPSDTCFAIPERPTHDTPVLVYLHGPYQGRGSPEEWATVRVALERGFAIVLPRGKRGLCAWRAEFRDHYCWPEGPEDMQEVSNVVADWGRVLWQVDALLEKGTHKRYVLGFASGGTFASLLATRQIFQGDAYAIVNGGPVRFPSDPPFPVPQLLVVGEATDVMPKMKAWHESLTKARWPHAFCPRAGGMAVTSEDVEVALRFFQRDLQASLKEENGRYPCEPARR